MTIRRKLAQIDIEFEKNARKAFPNHRSMVEITKELNKLLEEAIYGYKKKR